MKDWIESLWPLPSVDELNDAELADYYSQPEIDRPWVRANFVASIDGAASVGGRSEGLSTLGDRRLFKILRGQADAILVGARTVREEGYGDTHVDISDYSDLRLRNHQAPVPPVVVVTRSANISPVSPVITENIVAPVVVTTHAAPTGRVDSLRQAGADVLLMGDTEVPLPELIQHLERKGMHRILCEGGPQLLGELIVHDLVDELCLTVSPLLATSEAGRISSAPSETVALREMRLMSVLLGEDHSLLIRYRKRAVT